MPRPGPAEGSASHDGQRVRGPRNGLAVARLAGAAALALAILLAGGHLTPARQDPPAQLIADASVGDDLRTLALGTWERFLGAFAARQACFGDVRLRASTALASQASYDPATATVTVRVPGTAAVLRGALVHEWAHHVEFQCPAQAALRPAFLAAQGLPPRTPWRPAETPTDASAGQWAAVPSEQYAEAVVLLVLGSEALPSRARLSPEAIATVARWLEEEERQD
jgi:hypothetical protein